MEGVHVVGHHTLGRVVELGHGTALISVATTELFAGLQKLDRAQEEASLDLGATLGPVWFGLMLDHGLAREMFFVIAALLVIAIGTVVNVRRAMAARAV